jgi:hypothetical protein
MVMKNWPNDARANYLQKGDYIDDFFKEQANIIEDNDMALNAADYFNVGRMMDMGIDGDLVLPCVRLQNCCLQWLDVLVS